MRDIKRVRPSLHSLRRQAMGLPVEAEAQAMLVGHSACLAVRVALRYQPADPYVVTATASDVDGSTICWTAARDVFADGLSARSVDGDVVVQPSDLAPGLLVRMLIVRECGDATQVEVSAPGLQRFLQRTFCSVPSGCEDARLDLGGDITRVGRRTRVRNV